MKSIHPIVLALAAKVSASPIESSSADLVSRGVLYEGEESLISDSTVDTISTMEFVGPITPGGPDVTLSGSAKDIYDQIMELNPSYDVFDFPGYAEDLEAQGFTRENLDTPDLITRNPTLAARDALAKRDNFNCNIGKWVGNVHTQCTEGMVYLRKLGKAWCGAKPRSYSRVSCSNKCGMYLYSKFDKEIRVYCTDIATDMQKIVAECGQDWGDWVTEARGRLAFREHNTELSSANC